MGKKKKSKTLEIQGTQQSKHPDKLESTAEILTSVFNEIESRSIGGSVAGIPVNFYDLDAMTLGLQRGSLIVIAGRPGMGKTSIALNIAKNVAQIHNLPVCLFGLEMSKEHYTYRLLTMEVGIESGRLRTGRLQQEEWPILGQGIESLGQLPIFISGKSNITVEGMIDKCEKIIKKQRKELGLVLVDYVQLLDGSGSESRDEELSKIVIELKGMARKLNVPVLLLSQLNRDLELRINKRPMLSDLRETQALESHSDVVIMLYRDEYYDPDTCDRGITELIVCKHRNGPIGTVKMLFEPQFARFRNLAA
tara:strand:+ start:779 stop:1702 length:924 start_codon:yes stop_codon:yes gene_type:complete